MYDLANFTLKEMAECDSVLRNMSSETKNMEEVQA